MADGYEGCLDRRDFLIGALAASGALATLEFDDCNSADDVWLATCFGGVGRKGGRLATRHHPSNFTRGFGLRRNFPLQK